MDEGKSKEKRIVKAQKAEPYFHSTNVKKTKASEEKKYFVNIKKEPKIKKIKLKKDNLKLIGLIILSIIVIITFLILFIPNYINKIQNPETIDIPFDTTPTTNEDEDVNG